MPVPPRSALTSPRRVHEGGYRWPQYPASTNEKTSGKPLVFSFSEYSRELPVLPLADLRGLTAKLAEVVELGATDAAAALDLELGDSR